MKNRNFEIKLNLQKQIPPDFLIKYEELEYWIYKQYKPNRDLKDDEFKFNIRSCNEAEVLYEDTTKIAGRFTLNATDSNNNKIIIPFDFMIAKQIIEKTKQRIRWETARKYFSQFTEKQVDSINLKVVDTLMPECLERLRQYKAFLAQKKLQESKKK